MVSWWIVMGIAFVQAVLWMVLRDGLPEMHRGLPLILLGLVIVTVLYVAIGELIVHG